MRMRSLLAAVFPLATAGILALPNTPAFAAWPHDPATGGVFATTTNNAHQMQAVSDDNGGTIVVYTIPVYSGVVAQRVDANGNPLWGPNGVILSTGAGAHWNPALISNGSGGAIMAWEDQRNGSEDIFVQKLNASGTPQWAIGGVAQCTAPGTQQLPIIASDDAGGAVVVWEDARNLSLDLYARRISASGTPMWTADGIVVCAAAGNGNHYAAITDDGAGNVFIAWRDLRNDNDDIFIQRLTSYGAGSFAANGIGIPTPASSFQGNPAICRDGANGCIVAWEDARAGLGTSEVFAEDVSSTGVLRWAAGGWAWTRTARAWQVASASAPTAWAGPSSPGRTTVPPTTTSTRGE